MDLEAIVHNNISAQDQEHLREGQRNVFVNALAAFCQVSSCPLCDRDRSLVNRVEAAWEEVCAAENHRVLKGPQILSWLLSSVRTRVQDSNAALTALTFGARVEVAWPGHLSVYALTDVPDIERKLSGDSTFFNADGTSVTPSIITDLVARGAWMDHLRSALGYVAEFQPDVAAVYPKFVQYHIALEVGQCATGSFGVSNTCRDAPAVIACSDMIPLVQAGTLVHEFRHNVLYAIQEIDPLVDERSGETFKSPWRSDPRPLGGLLHGAFVFDGICRLYTSMAGGHALSAPNRRAAAKQAIGQSSNLAEAISTLRSAPGLTVMGTELVRYLEESAKHHSRQAETLAKREKIEPNPTVLGSTR